MKENLKLIYLGIFCIPCIIIVLMISGIYIPPNIGAFAIAWFLIQFFLYPGFRFVISFLNE